MIQQVIFQSKGQLYRRGADQQGHDIFRLNVYILKIFTLHELHYPFQEPTPTRHIQAFIIWIVLRELIIKDLMLGFVEGNYFLPLGNIAEMRQQAGKQKAYNDDNNKNRTIHRHKIVKIQILSASTNPLCKLLSFKLPLPLV